jgi:hypothetical protein
MCALSHTARKETPLLERDVWETRTIASRPKMSTACQGRDSSFAARDRYH